MYYDVSTTALYTAPITICISYAGVSFPGLPKLYHFEGMPVQTRDITTIFYPVSQIVCGAANSLSPFALMVPVNAAPLRPRRSRCDARVQRGPDSGHARRIGLLGCGR